MRVGQFSAKILPCPFTADSNIARMGRKFCNLYFVCTKTGFSNQG